MATPTGAVDPNDGFWRLSVNQPGWIRIIIPFLDPPQADHWEGGGASRRQNISFNPFCYTSRTGAVYSYFQATVTAGSYTSNDNIGESPGLFWEYEDFALTTEFENMPQRPIESDAIHTGIYGPKANDPGYENERMEYRDIHIEFERSFQPGDTEQLKWLMGAHFECGHDNAYANEDYEHIQQEKIDPADTFWIWNEQRPISAWQMKNLMCENQNRVAYTHTSAMSLAMIGVESVY
jgi:hypothetical protein